MLGPLVDISIVLCDYGLAVSKSEARRLITKRAVSINNRVIDSSLVEKKELDHALIKVGKHKMVHL